MTLKIFKFKRKIRLPPNICQSKVTVKERTEKLRSKKIFAKCTYGKGLVSRINKELPELNNLKNVINWQLEEDLNGYFTK